jgi:hypothetical protein
MLQSVDPQPVGPGASASAASLLVFIHIPKTAGTTLGKLLRLHYGDAFGRVNTSGAWSAEELRDRVRAASAKPGVRVLQGHIPFGMQAVLPDDAQYVTVLRDPVERVLSQYHHLVTRTGKWTHAHLPPPSPELDLSECIGPCSYISDNLQTRMLCGMGSRIEPLPEGALEQAKRNLRHRFAWVGTTERFDEFLGLLNGLLGVPAVASDPARVSIGRPQREGLSPDLRALVEETHVLDAELHRYADGLLGEALARREADVAPTLLGN